MSQIPVAVALLAIAAATLLAGAARRWLFGWTSVTSHSMMPTLRPGQRLLTLRARDIHRLRRGDIVVLLSRELGVDVIKRVIGLPGDQVHIHRDGILAVNGSPLTEPYLAFPGGPGGRFHVPPGRMLVLGDNRAASSDSRHWVEPYPPQVDLRGRLLRTRRHHPPLDTALSRAADPYAPANRPEDAFL